MGTLIEVKLTDIGFCGGEKTGELGENPSEQGKNKQQAQPTYDTPGRN